MYPVHARDPYSIANCFFAETPGRLEDAEELEKCVSGQKLWFLSTWAVIKTLVGWVNRGLYYPVIKDV